MKNDFSSPQRQSLLGIVILGADALQTSIRAFLPIVLLYIVQGKIPKLYLALGFSAVLLISLITGYLQYRNFIFYLDNENDEFVLRKGVLNKTRVAIPVDKIQNVNITQSLLQKIIKVHGLEIDTAGSNKTEVKIKAISHGQALSLKELLLEEARAYTPLNEEGVAAAHVAGQSVRPFIEISLMSLFKTGITSNYIRSFGVLLAFFISSVQYIDDYVNYIDYDGDVYDDFTDYFIKYMAFTVLFIMFLVVVINLFRTVIRYFNFKITRQNNTLLLAYGLINTRNTIIKPEKVQMVSVSQNYFQKKLDINDLRIKQATDIEISTEKRKSALEIPGCDGREKQVLLNFLLDKSPERGEELKPNYRRLVLNFFKALAMPLGIYFTAAKIWPNVYDYGYFALFYAITVTLLLAFGYKNYRLFVNNDFIIKQSGAWDVQNEFMAPHKIHTIKVTQYFWQKRADVAAVEIHTAGGQLNYGVANHTRLKGYINQWLYQVETTAKHWM
jgi:putative membrane protein